MDFETNKDIRARLRWDSGSRTVVDAKISFSDLEAGSYYYRPRYRLEDSFLEYPIISDVASVAFRTILNGTLKIEHDADFATLTSISGFTRTEERYGVPFEGRGSNQMGDVDFVNAEWINRTLPTLSTDDAALLSGVLTNVGAHNFYDVESYSHEIRLTSPSDGRIRWVAGANAIWTDRSDTVRADLTIPGSPPLEARLPNGDAGPSDFVTTSGLLFNTVNTQNNLAWALFASVDFDITDQLTLTAALRYDQDEREITRIDGPTIDTMGTGIGNFGFDCTVGVGGCVPQGTVDKATCPSSEHLAQLAAQVYGVWASSWFDV